MNPRGNNLNAASFGFVYFNTNNKNVNNTDFMSFNDPATCSPPQGNRFSPVQYSTPTKFQKSPRNYYGRQSGSRNSFRYHNSPDNHSFNSPNFNNSRNQNKSQYGRNNSGFNNSGKSNANISRYYDPTCLKDPWAELEQNLKKTQAVETKVDSPKTDVEENSSNSDDEQESEVESKASSSELDEGLT